MINDNKAFKEKTKVSVILPAHNEEQHIRKSIESLKKQSYDCSLIEIIVVDNKSTDKTRTIAEDLSVRVLFLPDGPVGRVRNTGARLSSGEILFFLDADCVAPKHWINHAVKRIKNDPKLVLGGGYELRDQPYKIEKLWLLEGPEGALLPKELLGGCIAISRQTFTCAGGFDESITSGEDSKLSQDLKKMGYLVEIDRAMSVVHLGNPTSISQFIKRQVWHSENYFKNTKESIKDKIFLISSLFLASIVISVLALPFNVMTSILSLSIFTLLPLPLSIKRIKRSGDLNHLKRLPEIYAIDLLYLIGRAGGIAKGLYKKIV